MNLFVKIENNNVKLHPFFLPHYIPKWHFSIFISCKRKCYVGWWDRESYGYMSYLCMVVKEVCVIYSGQRSTTQLKKWLFNRISCKQN